MKSGHNQSKLAERAALDALQGRPSDMAQCGEQAAPNEPTLIGRAQETLERLDQLSATLQDLDRRIWSPRPALDGCLGPRAEVDANLEELLTQISQRAASLCGYAATITYRV